MSQFTIVINAGGKSTRMGTDKAFVEIGGRPMIERILESTRGLGDQIIIANDPARYSHLGPPVVADTLPGHGALGGLYTAIQAASTPYAFVLACDMPFVNRPLLEYMMSLAPDFDAVVPRLAPSPSPPPFELSQMGEGKGVGVEPFRAIYGKACLHPIRRALEAGKMRVISFFPDTHIRWVEEAEIRPFDPELLTFMNCNTPEELEQAREVWRRREAS